MDVQILGDALVLGGSFLYACSNLGQEVFVNDYSPQEYLGYIGVFGSAISGVQLYLLLLLLLIILLIILSPLFSQLIIAHSIE